MMVVMMLFGRVVVQVWFARSRIKCVLVSSQRVCVCACAVVDVVVWCGVVWWLYVVNGGGGGSRHFLVGGGLLRRESRSD
jgi:hypothetical protein